METPKLTVEWVPLDKLSGNPANPRNNDNAVPHVAASLRRFGWQHPLVVKRSGEVIAGNTRLKAARSLVMERVPVVWFDGTELDATAFSIADNRTHEFATWDVRALSKLLDELRREDALDGVGFVASDLDRLIAEIALTTGELQVEDPGPEPSPIELVSRSGDLWCLGAHRLLCGDSTRPDDVERVLSGDTAELLATDPPYCVDYTGADRPQGSGKDWSHLYREVDIRDLGEFLDKVLTAALRHLADRAAVYLWHAHLQQPVLAAAFDRHGLLLHQILVWVKPTAVFGHSYYHWRHEPCAFGWKKGSKPEHARQVLNSVWDVDWDGKQRVVGNLHPTEKPTRLFEIPLEQHTVPGAVVLELFSGSGSQIIAAEKLKRRCRALEIVPAFVDVAVRRWERATGKQATLELDGRTFSEIEAERRSR